MNSPSSRRRVRSALVVSVVAVLVGAAVAGCGTPAPQWQSSGGPTASASAAATESPDVTLAFAGDVHFTERTLKLLDDPATAFGPVADILGAADLAMVNLETAVTARGKAEPKQFHFRAPATAYEAIKAAGIDVVSLANNHTMDYGRDGLADTIAAAKDAGVYAIGAGDTVEQAYKPFFTTIKGVKIAIVALNQVNELRKQWIVRDGRSGIAYAQDLTNASDAIGSAASAADVVIVFMHWGQENNQCPTWEMRNFVRMMSEAGATMFIGTHAHTLQGGGWNDSVYVQYGLGNFVWWRNDAKSNDTGVFQVTISPKGKIKKAELVPAVIDRTTGQPIPVSGGEADRIAKKYAGLRKCAQLTAAP